jgi:hypothetical protein
MSSTLIALVGLIYLAVCIDLYFKGNTGLSIAFLGYAIGNVGLFLETVTK